jgi:hypothetical protein
MASGAPSPGGWLRTPTSVPLIPVSSEYDRLLVQEPLNELGGGPMDPAADERLLVLNDASRIAAEGLAERIAARAASPRGVVLGSIACFALMCFAAFRKAESHDASLVARLSEGMFLGGHRGGDSDSRRAEGRAAAPEGHEFSLEHRLAPRAAAMPRDDDGAAQRAVDDAVAGASERSALRAALRGAATAPTDDADGSARRGGSARARAGLGNERDVSFEWGPTQRWEDEARADGGAGQARWKPYARETHSRGGGGDREASEDWSSRARARSIPAEDEEDAFFAVDADGDAYGAARASRRAGDRRTPRASARQRRGTGGFTFSGDDAFLPVVEPTEVAHGATHQAALDELEASIKSSVVEEHERRRKQRRADAETKRGARVERSARA